MQYITIIPGRLEEAKPEFRDYQMCNRTSQFAIAGAPE